MNIAAEENPAPTPPPPSLPTKKKVGPEDLTPKKNPTEAVDVKKKKKKKKKIPAS